MPANSRPPNPGLTSQESKCHSHAATTARDTPFAAWCADASAADPATRYDFVFVDQKGFEKHPSSSFAGLAAAFTEFKA